MKFAGGRDSHCPFMFLQLVSVVAQRLGIRINDLSPGEKIQLITAAVGAWQTFQQRDHHRDTSACAPLPQPMSFGSAQNAHFAQAGVCHLSVGLSADLSRRVNKIPSVSSKQPVMFEPACSQSEAANTMRSEHNRLVATGISDKRARFQSQEALRGVARLQQVPCFAVCDFAPQALHHKHRSPKNGAPLIILVASTFIVILAMHLLPIRGNWGDLILLHIRMACFECGTDTPR